MCYLQCLVVLKPVQQRSPSFEVCAKQLSLKKPVTVIYHALDLNNSLHLYLFTFFLVVFLIRIMP